MASKSKLLTLQKTYHKRMDSLLNSNESFRNFTDLLKRSDDNTVFQHRREENKIYDEKWIDNLDQGFEAIDMIIKAPRSFIKEDAQVVLAALAKRITSESVQNLAMHSEYVREIDDKGNVVPDKILSISTEEDFQIYENRFLMTLMKKLVIFIERRYQFIRDHGETTDSDLLVIHNVSEIDGITYEVDTRLKASKPSEDNGQRQHNADLLDRILRLRDRASFYLTCPFMKKMAGAKPVHNPLSMTNMLMKSPYYHKAYELWKFIDSYEKLGITYSVKETEQTFDAAYYNEIYGLVAGGVLTLNSHQIDSTVVEKSKSKKRLLTPKVLLSLDDETFLDGKFTYHEFPEAEDGAPTARTKGQLPPTPEDIRKIKEKEEQRALAEKKKAEEIAAKQAEYKRIQEQKEAAEAAAKRKKLEAQLAKIVAAQQALQKKMEEARLAKEAAEREKARQEQIRLEQELLEKTREGVKKAAVEDKSIDASLLAAEEKERQERLALEKKKEEEAEELRKKQEALAEAQALQKAQLEAALAHARDLELASQAAAKEAEERALEEKARLKASKEAEEAAKKAAEEAEEKRKEQAEKDADAKFLFMINKSRPKPVNPPMSGTKEKVFALRGVKKPAPSAPVLKKKAIKFAPIVDKEKKGSK
jgi:hypothetical protein